MSRRRPIDKVLDGVRENLDTCLSNTDGTLRGYPSLDAMAQRLEQAKGIEFAAARALVERGHRKTDAGYVWSTEPRIRRTHTQRQPDDIVVALAKRTTAPTLMIAARNGEEWFKHSLDLVAACCRCSKKWFWMGLTTCTCRRRCRRLSRRSDAFSPLTGTTERNGCCAACRTD